MTASTRRKHKPVARKFPCVLMVDAQMFGSRSQPLGTADQASLCKIDDEKRVCPWVTGRAWAFAPGHPRVPARLRVGGRVWRRFLRRPPPGDLAVNITMRRPGRAWVRARGNRPSCSCSSSRSRESSSGGKHPVALADGMGMATSREALGLAGLPNRTARPPARGN